MGLPLLASNKALALKLLESPMADGGRFLMDASAAPGICNQQQNHIWFTRDRLYNMLTMLGRDGNYAFSIFCHTTALTHLVSLNGRI